MAGELDVKGMLRRMSAREWAEWQLYYDVEPFGDRRGDYQAALIAKMIADVQNAKKTGGGELTIDDLLLQFNLRDELAPAPENKRVALESQIAMAHAIAMIYNPSVKAKDV
jgi:hypothetical protein